MNNKNKIVLFLINSFTLILLLVSCKNNTKESEYHNIIDKIEANSINYHNTTILPDKNIKTIKFNDTIHSFLITERKSKIKSYSCTECHEKSFKKIKNSKKQKEAHWNIELIHADKNTMNCATCHSDNNIDNLKSLTNKKIDFNRSYNLCSQCHSKEFNDWKGGAHGKQIGGWTPPKIIKNCVDCHNPHKPGFEKRLPSWYNTKTAKKRK